MSSQADGGSVSTREQAEAIRQLVAIGEEKGYLLREEIDTVLPPDVTSSSVLNDLLSQCRDVGIDVDLESVERDGTPSRRDTSSDIVQVYLADMSRTLLLTREQEVALAKQIERGNLTVMMALSHTPSLVQQVIRLADTLREDGRRVRRLVKHRHGDVTATRLKRRTRQVRVQIEEVRAAWADAQTRYADWQRVPTRHRRIAQGAQWQMRRARARVAQLTRRIAFSDEARRDFIEEFRASASVVASAQRKVEVIERRLRQRTTQTRLTGSPRRRVLRQLHEARTVLAHLTEPLQQTPVAVRRTLEKMAHGEARPSRRRTRWSRPTSVWSCRSPRSTPLAVYHFWTSFRKATSDSCGPWTSSSIAGASSSLRMPRGGSSRPSDGRLRTGRAPSGSPPTCLSGSAI